MALVFGIGLPASAQTTNTWNGGSDANWSTAANWTPGPLSPGDTLVFAGSSNANPNNNDTAANTPYGDIIFDPTAGSFDLTGNAIDFGSLIQNNSSTAQAIDLPIVLTNSATVAATSGDISIGVNAGGISGTGPLTVNGPGTLTVSNKTYIGGTTINSGAKMIVENDNGNYTLAGGTLELTYGSWGSGANYAFTADSSLGVIAGGPNYNNRGRYDASGTVGSPGFKWTVVGDGRFQILGQVRAGSVEVTAPAVLGALANGNANITGLGTNTITVDNGAALRINNGGIVLAPIVLDGGQGPDNQGALVANQEGYSGLGSVAIATFSNTITLLNDNGDTYFGAQTSDGNSFPATLAIPGNITGPGGLQKIGPNLLTLSGSNSFAGNVTINTGTVRLGSSNAIPSTATVYVNGSSSLDLNGNNTLINTLNEDGLGNATVDNTSANPATLGVTNCTLYGAVKNTGSGALSVVNYGYTLLLGANSYSGSNVVQGGTLEINIPTGTTTGGLVQIADSATLTLHKTSPASSLKAAGAVLGNSTLNLYLSNYGNPSAPIISATNGAGVLAANGTLSINFYETANLVVGQFPLIKYTSRTGGGNFVIGYLDYNYTAQIVTNVANSSIDLKITSAPITTWKGYVNNLWDLTTTNWNFAGIHTNYNDYSGVLLDDTALTNTVDLTTALMPASVIVSTTNTYTLTGAGGLTAGDLTKNGSGTLVLLTTNTYNTTTISAGTLQVGANGTAGSLGSGSVNNSGTLSLTRSDNVTIANVISGSGVVAQNNTNIVTLSGANTYSGGTLVNQGVVKLGAATALGAPGSVNTMAVVASVASLDINGNLVTTTNALVVSGLGVSSNLGVVHNSGTGAQIGGSGYKGFNNLRLAADAAIGNNGGDFTIGDSGPGIDGRGFNLEKIGGNAVYLRAAAVSALSSFTLGGGGIIFMNANPFGPTATLVISNNAWLDSWGNNSGSPSYTIANNIIITNGGGQITTTRGHWWDRPDYDTYTGSITLNANLTVKNSSVYSGKPGQLTLTGPMAGSGNVTKTGAYLVTLSGVNTYTGNTTISQGALAISAISQGGGGYTNMDGATLDVPSQTGYATVPMSTLALGSINGSTLSLSRVTSFSANQAPITATNLVLTGTNSVLLPAAAFAGAPGEYPLIKYSAVSGTGIVAIGGGVRGVPGYLTNDTANSQIALVIPGGTPVVWTGANNNTWDINTTANWKTNGVATTYQQFGTLGDVVTFDDSSSVTNVNLASSVSPTMIVVNNTNNLYTLTGSIITNATALLKEGTGTLVLSNGANTFTGGATIIGGTVKLGNAGSLNNSSGRVTVSGNGALDFNYQQPTALACTISGAGFNGLGTLVANYTNAAQAYGPASITLAGSATIGGSNRWDLRNGANTLNTPTNAYTLTKVGAGYTALVSTKVSTNLGDIYILGGTLGYQTGTTGLGNPTNTIYIGNGGVLEMWSATVPLNKFIVMSNGASINPDSGGGGSGLTPTTQNIISGPIYLAGPNGGSAPQIQCNWYNGCAISNTISGPGGLLFNYNAYNRLYAPNTYTGDTTIYGGVYLFANSCIVSTNITINVGPLYLTNNAYAGVSSTYLNDNLGGVILAGNASVNFAKLQIGGGGNQSYVDASARTDGTFTLPANSVAYSGSAANNYIKGNFVVTTGSTLSIGNVGSPQVLSCSNNVTFQAGSTNVVDVNKTATVTNSDLLNVTGTINYGGVLRIQTNGTVALVAGDTFKVVNAGGNNGNFANIVDPSGATWSFNPASGVLTVVTPPPTVNTSPTNIITTLSGTSLTMEWPSDHIGWFLQSNSISLLDTNAWFNVPNSQTTNKVVIQVDAAQTNVFYRMKY